MRTSSTGKALACVVFLACACGAWAADTTWTDDNGVKYLSSDGTTATVTGYSGSATEVTIDETVTNNGITYTVTKLGNAAFKKNTTITKVVLPDTVTEIVAGKNGSAAFTQCTALTGVTMKGVTIIGTYTFQGCTKLVEVAMPTNLVTVIGPGAFENCNRLPGDFDFASLTTLGQDAFSFAYAVTSVKLPVAITNIGWKTFNMGNSNKSNLKTVIAPGVKRVGGNAFYYCRKLVNLTLSEEGLDAVGADAFEYCESLESEINIASVRDIPFRAFFYCKKVPKLTMVPEQIESIGAAAFENCALLTGDLNFANVTNLGNDALRETAITSVRIPKVTTLATKTFLGCKSLIDIYMPNVTLIKGSNSGESPFNTCTALENVEIPAKVQLSGTHTFFALSSLKDVSIPLLRNIPNCTFDACTALKSVYTPQVTNISYYAFYKVPFEGKQYKMPYGVKSLGSRIFGSDTYKITNVLVHVASPLTHDQLTNALYTSSIKYSYYGGTTKVGDIDLAYDTRADGTRIILGSTNATGTLALPSSIDGKRVTELEAGAFMDATLTSVTVPGCIATIGIGAFPANCEIRIQETGENDKLIDNLKAEYPNQVKPFTAGLRLIVR